MQVQAVNNNINFGTEVRFWDKTVKQEVMKAVDSNNKCKHKFTELLNAHKNDAICFQIGNRTPNANFLWCKNLRTEIPIYEEFPINGELNEKSNIINRLLSKMTDKNSFLYKSFWGE